MSLGSLGATQSPCLSCSTLNVVSIASITHQVLFPVGHQVGASPSRRMRHGSLLRCVWAWAVLTASVCYIAPARAVQAVQAARAPGPLSLQIVHLNDFHARYEEVSRTAGACKEGDQCIGGLARVVSAIEAERARNGELLLLNAGDNYQGTLWYSLFRWNVTAYFMNNLPWDALVGGTSDSSPSTHERRCYAATHSIVSRG